MVFNFRHVFLNIFSISVVIAGFSFGAMAQDVTRPEPEIATGLTSVSSVKGTEFMAVTANPHATRAAADILDQGGNAADAAIAAQLVLGLTEPQSSGLGGGAFVVYYDAQNDKVITLDARETAPAAATPDMFLDKNAAPALYHPAPYDPMPYLDAAHSGLSVGVPGIPALLAYLHKNYGTMTRGEPFDAAITLAENGFAISPRLAAMIAHDAGYLAHDKRAAAYFLDDKGAPREAGTVLKNQAYAQTLQSLKKGGARWFYHEQGQLIAPLVQSRGGLLTARDFAAYRVIPRDPVCAPYRIYTICSIGEPSSGGLTILSALGMLERFDLSAGPTPENVHLVLEASRLAFADRNKFMADPAFVTSPGAKLIDKDYLTSRSALIHPARAMAHAVAGAADPENGTSHISIVDAKGNVLLMTTTIEGAFGSKIMTEGGFLLNNELTDFSFIPYDAQGISVANRVEGGKRPRSSMAPIIVFNAEGAPVLALGSAGGSRIIGFVLQRIIAALDWDIPPEYAIAMPHFLARSDTAELEYGSPLAESLQAMGHRVAVSDMSSGITALQWHRTITHGDVTYDDITGGDIIHADIIQGVADPRREGVAAGR